MVAAFAQLLEAFERAGVTLVTRRTSAAVETLERAIANATAVASGITGWENRWSTRNLVDQHPEGVSERARAVLARSEAMSVGDYRALLLQRELPQATYARMAGRRRDYAVSARRHHATAAACRWACG